jgi:pyruvyltransferase
MINTSIFFADPQSDPERMAISPSKNWGDVISYMLIKYFSKSNKIAPEDVFWFDPNGVQLLKNGKILAVGSAMKFTKPNDLVWGTGVISPGTIGDIPKKVYAVRGPLSKNEMIKKGIKVPEIYGDPALLFPKIYNPSNVIRKKHKLGIIPHYIDYVDSNVIDRLKELEQQGIKIINITAGVFHFIDEILSCEKIVSSTLHGLIAADAYGIPNARIKLSNRIQGGNFKYDDYYASIHRPSLLNNINIFEPINLNTLMNLQFNCEFNLDLDLLLNNSPWMDPDNKDYF